jgi:hypothetical protein
MMGRVDPRADELRALLSDHVDWLALLLAGEPHDSTVDVLEIVNGQLGDELPEHVVSLFLSAVLKRRGTMWSSAGVDPAVARLRPH